MRRWIEFGRTATGNGIYYDPVGFGSLWVRMPYKSELYEIINVASGTGTQDGDLSWTPDEQDPNPEQHQIKEGCQAFHVSSGRMPSFGHNSGSFSNFLFSGFSNKQFQTVPYIFQISSQKPTGRGSQ